jgi:tRNA A58 N-methylase Trm61
MHAQAKGGFREMPFRKRIVFHFSALIFLPGLMLVTLDLCSRHKSCLSAALVLCGLSNPNLPTRAAEPPGPPPALSNLYSFSQNHDRDGIGKFFMGREIAQVMGHEASDWLERPERDAEERPGALVNELQLKAGDVVADIGAGTGYFSRRLARAVGPTGKVLAEDIQPEMLNLLTNSLTASGITNVIPVLGTVANPKLPDQALDLVLLVDVYHEFEFPFEMVSNICRALKPRGRIVFVEYRAEDPKVPIKPLHKMSQAQVKKEMSVQPLDWLKTIEVLPRQHIIEFRKRQVS